MRASGNRGGCDGRRRRLEEKSASIHEQSPIKIELQPGTTHLPAIIPSLGDVEQECA